MDKLILPAIANTHSHAFQRAMAGLTEYRSASQDSFWTWRELMYRFASQITPDPSTAGRARRVSADDVDLLRCQARSLERQANAFGLSLGVREHKVGKPRTNCTGGL